MREESARRWTSPLWRPGRPDDEARLGSEPLTGRVLDEAAFSFASHLAARGSRCARTTSCRQRHAVSWQGGHRAGASSWSARHWSGRLAEVDEALETMAARQAAFHRGLDDGRDEESERQGRSDRTISLALSQGKRLRGLEPIEQKLVQPAMGVGECIDDDRPSVGARGMSQKGGECAYRDRLEKDRSLRQTRRSCSYTPVLWATAR
jgi:hypothetical protein